MPRLKDDEVRFRHACNDVPGASLEELAELADVPLPRARNLHKRWLGAANETLPPLPEAIPPTEEEPPASASVAAPSTGDAPSDAAAANPPAEGEEAHVG
jgi:hypothetical protein